VVIGSQPHAPEETGGKRVSILPACQTVPSNSMFRRLLVILIIVSCLLGLIIYSEFRPEPNCVSGFIETDEIRVGSRVGGRVGAVLVEEGQRVRRGQTLVELEPFDLLAREKEAVFALAACEAEFQRLTAGLRDEEVAQAKARYDQLQAKYDLLKEGPRTEEIEAARGRLQIAQAERTLAQQVFDRQKELSRKEAASLEDLDRAGESLASAEAMVRVREDELELLELGTREEELRAADAAKEEAKQAWQLAKSGFRREEIEKSKAARDAAQATVEAVRTQLEELKITSPLDGVVEALDLQPGDLVAAGAPVLSLIDDRHPWVRAYIPQSRADLQLGQKLRVAVDCFPDETFIGPITFISRQAEFTPSNVQTPEERAKQVYRIKVSLDAGADKLRPGMTVTVWLDAEDPAL
jgi:multidrug resistance efflux pump